MIPTMRRGGVGMAFAIAAIAAAAFAQGCSISFRSTYCAGFFPTRAQAERVADDARETGFSDVEVRRDRRRTSVLVSVPETGADAEPARRAFSRILAHHDGKRGHPGDGCWERGFGD